MKMLLHTVRMVDHDQVREYAFGDNNSLTEKLAIGLINPDDFKNLNLISKLNLKLNNNNGSVIIKPIQEKNVPLGTIIMPVSIWANQITGIENNELVYKNIEVNVETTNDSVLDINDLLSLIRD
ncbi:MAG: molybdopterin dinucleotide binding domain-containing protein [Promethearchaeota archaeon]